MPAYRLHRVTLVLPDGSRAHLRVRDDEFVLAAAVRAGIQLPSMCLQGWCISCAGRVEANGQWDQSASRRYFEQDREAGYILLCTARPQSDLIIHTHRREELRDLRLRCGLPTPRA